MLLLAACLAPAVLAQPAAQHQQTLTLALAASAEPDNLDPSRVTPTGSSTAIVRQLFEPLLRLDERLIPQPAAAAAYEVSPDGTLVTFHLRPDGAWSDGQPVTAQQFAYAWKRLLDPRLHAAYAPLFVDAGIVGADDYNLGRVRDAGRVGIQALDDLTLQVRLVQPFGALPALAALPVAAPLRQDLVDADPDGWSRDPATLVGNGPFRLVEWPRQDHLRLVPNPAYASHPGWPRPTLDAVTFVLSGDDPERELSAFRDGQRDWLAVPEASINQVLNDPSLAPLARQSTDLTTYWLSINAEHPPLDDLQVRLALSRAIDRSQLIRQLATGVGVPMTSILPPGMPGYQPLLGQEVGFDAAAARALLAQAGFPDGHDFPTIGLSFGATAADLRRAEVVRGMWREQLGIDVELRPSDTASARSAIDSGEYDLALDGWAADDADPQDWFAAAFTCGGDRNRFGYCDPAFDRLVAWADSAPGLSLDARVSVYQQAQARLLQAVPVAPLYARGHLVLVRPWAQSADGGPVRLTAVDDYPGSLFLDQVRILPH